MIMTDFEVYQYYLALKLHFTTDRYDIIANKGRIKTASKEDFNKRTDLTHIRKIAKTYSNEEVANFLIANFVSGDRWGGVFDSEANVRYKHWKKKKESLQYVFKNELDAIINELEFDNKDATWLFKISKNEHPYIIKAFLRNAISIETLVIIERLVGYVEKFDAEVDDEFLWPDISRTIKRYKPFLKIEKDKYNAIYRNRVGLTTTET